MVEEHGGGRGGGGREWYIRGVKGRNKIYAIRQIYALLGFLNAHTVLLKDCMLFSRVTATSERRGG